MSVIDEDPDDAELVTCMVAYQAGEIEAFERLHATLAGELQRFLGAEVRDAGVAQDLVQETFLELHRARRTYLPPLPVRPWAFGIARNVARRHRRRAAQRAALQAQAPAALAEPTIAPPAVARRDLDAALRALPAGRRRAWLLHHWHGLSFAEIAGRLGIGLGAARLRSSRANSALKAFFTGAQGDDDE